MFGRREERERRRKEGGWVQRGREGGKERRDWALIRQVQVSRQKLPRKGRRKRC